MRVLASGKSIATTARYSFSIAGGKGNSRSSSVLFAPLLMPSQEVTGNHFVVFHGRPCSRTTRRNEPKLHRTQILRVRLALCRAGGAAQAFCGPAGTFQVGFRWLCAAWRRAQARPTLKKLRLRRTPPYPSAGFSSTLAIDRHPRSRLVQFPRLRPSSVQCAGPPVVRECLSNMEPNKLPVQSLVPNGVFAFFADGFTLTADAGHGLQAACWTRSLGDRDGQRRRKGGNQAPDGGAR